MWPLLLLLFSIAIFLIWRYYKNQRNYWKDRGIDGPEPSFFFGNLWDITDFFRPPVIVVGEWGKKFGKVFGIKEGVHNILVISDVPMLQELFIKKFDDFYGRKDTIMNMDVDNDPRVNVFRSRGIRWKRLRTICSSSFTSNSLRKVIGTVEDSTFELVRLLEEHENGEAVDVHRFYQEFTMDVISRIAMGQSESKMFKNPILSMAIKFFQRDVRTPTATLFHSVPILRPLLQKIFAKFGKIQKDTMRPIYAQIDKAVDERIAQREKEAEDGIEPGEPNDFVDLFLDAKAEGDIDNSAEFSKTNVKVTRKLTRDEIAAQCMMFLLAGYDTTSNALSYATWLLTAHPEKQKKLQEEIDEICGNDQSIGYDAVSKLKYAEAVLKEALRMYPLAGLAASRCAMKDTSLGEVKIEKGTTVQCDVWSLHNDNEIWGENVADFSPERWEDDRVKHSSAWVPFGAGPRVCLGMRLALMEAKLALAHIFRRFDLVTGPKTEKKLRLLGATVMFPESVTVYIKTRSS